MTPGVADLVDPRVAARFAARFAAAGPLDGSYLLDDLDAHFAALVAEAEPLVEEETGFAVGSPSTSRVLSRGEWASANVDSMLQLLAPLLERWDERVAGNPAVAVARMAYRPALGAQMGAVLGFLSRRVLGQYDVLVAGGNEVWFVGANIVAMERRFGFIPRDFRLWVVLHELTHRAQFEFNPWLREHFLASVREFLGSVEMDLGSFLARALEVLRNPRDEKPPGLRLLGPEQRARFDRLQAFMSVVEGHGSFVMDRIAERRIPTHARIRGTLRSSVASAPLMTKILYRLLGLDLKRKQYEEGQRFFDDVTAAAGRPGVTACFRGPEALPSLEEIRSPEAWLERVRA